MNYILFANPKSGSNILSLLVRNKFSPKVVFTTCANIDSWKMILLRIITKQLTVEDKLRFFYKIKFYDYRMINPERLKKIIKDNDIEIGFITTFSYFIKKEIYECFKYGVFNFHPSLLPLHAGANPIYWVLKNKDEFTGTTCYKITESLDRGKVFLQSKFKVNKMNEKQLFRKYEIDVSVMLPQICENYNGLEKKSFDSGVPIFDPKI